jgi:hypothetical protein
MMRTHATAAVPFDDDAPKAHCQPTPFFRVQGLTAPVPIFFAKRPHRFNNTEFQHAYSRKENSRTSLQPLTLRPKLPQQNPTAMQHI